MIRIRTPSGPNVDVSPVIRHVRCVIQSVARSHGCQDDPIRAERTRWCSKRSPPTNRCGVSARLPPRRPRQERRATDPRSRSARPAGSARLDTWRVDHHVEGAAGRHPLHGGTARRRPSAPGATAARHDETVLLFAREGNTMVVLDCVDSTPGAAHDGADRDGRTDRRSAAFDAFLAGGRAARAARTRARSRCGAFRGGASRRLLRDRRAVRERDRGGRADLERSGLPIATVTWSARRCASRRQKRGRWALESHAQPAPPPRHRRAFAPDVLIGIAPPLSSAVAPLIEGRCNDKGAIMKRIATVGGRRPRLRSAYHSPACLVGSTGIPGAAGPIRATRQSGQGDPPRHARRCLESTHRRPERAAHRGRPRGGTVFVPINPCRAIDSRGYTEPLHPGEVWWFDVLTTSRALPQIPPTAVAVTYNLTVTDVQGAGFIGSTQPTSAGREPPRSTSRTPAPISPTVARWPSASSTHLVRSRCTSDPPRVPASPTSSSTSPVTTSRRAEPDGPLTAAGRQRDDREPVTTISVRTKSR